jgi:hypothetical protein
MTSERPDGKMVRITFDVGEDVHKSLCLIPHGFRRYAYRWLIEGYALFIREHPEQALQQLMSRKLDYSLLLLQGAPGGRSVEREDESPEPEPTGTSGSNPRS